ncbi:filamentous hemagglutinin N-terminal domain-containing protein [Coleofasciculus sp. LEGE 07081]|uniref:beta strand repeat-containing protein n=1 Tax=Coleofasciculus sp. LEGE 07081 TaxID=2777967 RepID=UPI002AD3BDDE|nr:filamentous hemagglutinin N-terminal domain-containing protein [Coleofasciculus sp. LEGE 07081]
MNNLSDASLINGLIQVTGGNSNLYLMNPAGIVFGENASLNVPAAFTATTANGISFEGGWFYAVGDNNYQALVGSPNGFAFTMNEPGGIINAGDLAVSEGQNLTLLGGTVINTGTISTPGGNITVTAVPGENRVRISQEGMILSLEVESTAIANNSSLPSAAGISPLSIPELLTGNESTTGVAANSDGTVQLTESATTVPVNSGTAIVAGTLNTASSQTGGGVNILGDRVALVDATIDASGTNGGGRVSVGGDFKGEGTLPTASRTFVSSDSLINVNATDNGTGGQAVVWSNQITSFNGNITARGGEYSGDGGFVEVSGKDSLIFDGTVNTSAANGNFGTLLLDPKNIAIIGDGSPDDGDDDGSLENALGTDPNAATAEVLASEPPTGGTFQIYESELEGMSGDTNIILEATNNISVNDLPDDELLFKPGSGSLTFTADADDDGSGAFIMNDSADVIRAEGRSIDISGASLLVGYIDTSTSGDGGTIDLTSSGGDIKVNGGLNASSTGSGTGGTINLDVTAGLGAINISSSGVRVASTSESGDGGNVTFSTAGGDITTLDVDTSVNGDGTAGDIDFDIAANSEGTGQIDTSSGTLDASSATGDGGKITLTTAAGNIDTADVDTSSGDDGEGGEIFLTINGGVGSIDATNGTLRSTSVEGDGGEIKLSTNEGNISASTIDSFSSNGGVGAEITLDVAAGTGSINTTTGTLDSTSATGDGGNVELKTFQGSISTADINTFSEDADSVGGTIELKVEDIEGSIDTTGGTLTSGSTVADGGKIELTTSDGNIQTDNLDSSATGTGNGGKIDIDAGGGGDIDTTNGTLDSTTVDGNAGDIKLTTEDGNIQTATIDASASDEGTAGAVSLTVNGSPGLINATSGTINASSAGGNGNDVTLTTGGGNINTADVDTRSGGDGDAGRIRMDIAANSEVTGAIDTAGGTLFATSEAGNGGSISLTTAEGNIDTADVNSFSNGAGTGGNITLKIEGGEGSIDVTNGTLDSTSEGGNGGDIDLDTFEGSIATANLDSFSSNAGSTGGSISLTVNGTEGAIDATGGTITTGSTVANGGNVTLDTTATSTNGNLQTATVNTSSTGGGNGGDITLKTGQTGDIDTTVGTLNATSEDGNGGAISLTVNEGQILTDDLDSSVNGSGTGGAINLTAKDIPGIIDTSSSTLDSSSANGDGGAITIDTAGGGISTADVNSSSGGDGDGGKITFDIAASDERIGQIDTTAGTLDSSAAGGDGGDVSLTTAEGNISTSSINSFSDTTGGVGGNISLTIEDGIGSIDATTGTLTSGNSPATGGDIALSTNEGNISADDLDSSSTGSGNGGAISAEISAGTGDIDLSTAIVDSSSESGSGGDVTLTTADGNIQTSSILSFSNGVGLGGSITMTTNEAGSIDTSNGDAPILDSSSADGDGGKVELKSDVINVTSVNASGGVVGGDIIFTGDETNIADGSAVQSNGAELKFRPFSIAQDIRVNGASDTGASILDLTSEEISRLIDGFSSIIIGREDGTGTIFIVDDPNFKDPVIYLQPTEQE